MENELRRLVYKTLEDSINLSDTDQPIRLARFENDFAARIFSRIQTNFGLLSFILEIDSNMKYRILAAAGDENLVDQEFGIVKYDNSIFLFPLTDGLYFNGETIIRKEIIYGIVIDPAIVRINVPNHKDLLKKAETGFIFRFDKSYSNKMKDVYVDDLRVENFNSTGSARFEGDALIGKDATIVGGLDLGKDILLDGTDRIKTKIDFKGDLASVSVNYVDLLTNFRHNINAFTNAHNIEFGGNGSTFKINSQTINTASKEFNFDTDKEISIETKDSASNPSQNLNFFTKLAGSSVLLKNSNSISIGHKDGSLKLPRNIDILIDDDLSTLENADIFKSVDGDLNIAKNSKKITIGKQDGLLILPQNLDVIGSNVNMFSTAKSNVNFGSYGLLELDIKATDLRVDSSKITIGRTGMIPNINVLNENFRLNFSDNSYIDNSSSTGLEIKNKRIDLNSAENMNIISSNVIYMTAKNGFKLNTDGSSLNPTEPFINFSERIKLFNTYNLFRTESRFENSLILQSGLSGHGNLSWNLGGTGTNNQLEVFYFKNSNRVNLFKVNKDGFHFQSKFSGGILTVSEINSSDTNKIDIKSRELSFKTDNFRILGDFPNVNLKGLMINIEDQEINSSSSTFTTKSSISLEDKRIVFNNGYNLDYNFFLKNNKMISFWNNGTVSIEHNLQVRRNLETNRITNFQGGVLKIGGRDENPLLNIQDETVTVNGNLVVNGRTITQNTEEVTIKDKNITLGNVETASLDTADGGGITLKAGAYDSDNKTILWKKDTKKWTFNCGIDVLDNTIKAGRLEIGDALIDNTTTGGTSVEHNLEANELKVSGRVTTKNLQVKNNLTVGNITIPEINVKNNFTVEGSLEVTGSGSTTFSAAKFIIKDGEIISEVDDTLDNAKTMLLIKPKNDLKNINSKVLVVNNGESDLLTIKNRGMIEFASFDLITNETDRIRTSYASDGKQILKTPYLEVDGGITFEGQKFKDLSVQSDFNNDTSDTILVKNKEIKLMNLKSGGDLNVLGKITSKELITKNRLIFKRDTIEKSLTLDTDGNLKYDGRKVLLDTEILYGGTF